MENRNELGNLGYKYKLLYTLGNLKVSHKDCMTKGSAYGQVKYLIDILGPTDPEFVAKAIVYSRCIGNGLRSVSHLAAVLLAPYISGKPWGKVFYSTFNRADNTGGCIYRADDMKRILEIYKAHNTTSLPNSMKKGFARTIERMDTYSLVKYRRSLVDIINLVRPNPKKSSAMVTTNLGTVRTIDALMAYYPNNPHTWESMRSASGQFVSASVTVLKLDKKEQYALSKKSAAEDWNTVLNQGKLGILAALRNIRNILNCGDPELTKKLIRVLADSHMLVKGLIRPSQINTALRVCKSISSKRVKRSHLNHVTKTLYTLKKTPSFDKRVKTYVPRASEDTGLMESIINEVKKVKIS